MKKVLALAMTAVILCALAACGASKGSGTETGTGGAKCKLTSCRFADSVYGADGEFLGRGYPASDGKVYVDLVFEVTDAGTEGLSGNNVDGSVLFEDTEYVLHYCKEGKRATYVTEDPMEAHESGRMHLCASGLPARAASGEKLQVVYTVDGKEGRAYVEEKDTSAPMDRKTELREGSKVSAGGVDVTVFRCTNGKLLTSDEENSAIYAGTYIDLVLQVTNNGTEDVEIGEFFAWYVVGTDGKPVGSSTDVESEDHTRLEAKAGALGPGETRFYHMYVSPEESGDGIVRLNFEGSCYYVEAREW